MSIWHNPFDPHIEASKIMTPSDLMALGIQDIAYVKPVEIEGEAAYAIFAADGQELGYAEGRDLAIATVRHNDLEPVSVH